MSCIQDRSLDFQTFCQQTIIEDGIRSGTETYKDEITSTVFCFKYNARVEGDVIIFTNVTIQETRRVAYDSSIKINIIGTNMKNSDERPTVYKVSTNTFLHDSYLGDIDNDYTGWHFSESIKWVFPESSFRIFWL